MANYFEDIPSQVPYESRRRYGEFSNDIPDEATKPRLANMPEPINIDAWRSYMGSVGGLTKTNRYLVRINPYPAYSGTTFGRDLVYMCTGGELPGRSLNVQDYRYYGPTKKVVVQSEFNMLKLSFYLREGMEERRFFDNWFEVIQPQDTFDNEWRRNYETVIEIFKLSDYDAGDGYAEAQYSIELQQAFPITLNPVVMNWSDTDVGKFEIDFTYTRYTTNQKQITNGERKTIREQFE